MSKKRDSKQRIVFVQLPAEADASSVPDEIHVVPTGKGIAIAQLVRLELPNAKVGYFSNASMREIEIEREE